MNNWKTPKLKKLVQAFLSLRSQPEMMSFLRDLCTAEELEELSTRWEVAKMLEKGMPYRQIAMSTKTSTTTVARIAFWLEHGEGGYRVALKKEKKQLSTGGI